jgi:nucleoside-diphosphate-sugar epimerase
MSTKKTIFMTGSTGHMGGEALQRLLERTDRFQIKALILPDEQQKPSVQRLLGHKSLEILWGDLTNYEDVLAGVSGSDYVLHVGGMVSPLADGFPDLTMKVNVGGARNIVAAINAQYEPDKIRLVYIGSIAQTGSRMPPIHWGRVGDPIKISSFDHYAVSKTLAEAIVAESGLKHWVSLRQTGMVYLGIHEIFDPIIFHNPLNGVFEWTTARESGRLLANVCEENVPDSFWRHIYNIGGGATSRTTNYEFLAKSYAAMGIADLRKVLHPKWFATQNFHGQWYTDSDRLEALVPFRIESIADFIDEVKQSTPFYMKLAARFASSAVRRRMQLLAESPGGPLYWMENDEEERIDAFFGSREVWSQIPDWDEFELMQPSLTPLFLNHGYDETKSREAWDLSDLQGAAVFRGGRCLSDHFSGPFAPIEWRCAMGHDFTMTPNLMLAGGHWCPSCMIDPSCYPSVAHSNPFFAQVWQEN